jgi:hypothetical protein
MLVGSPQLTSQQTIKGAADRMVGGNPVGVGMARAEGAPVVLAVMILAAVGILAGLQVAGFRSTIAIGRA